MLTSMTGFGRAVLEYKNKKINIDVKSLNSKNIDINTRIPGYYREKELEIRRLLSQELKRGKIEFSMFVELTGTESSTQINGELVNNYYQQVKDIAKKNSIPVGLDIMSSLIKLPDVLKSPSSELNEEEWKLVLKTAKTAISNCIDFRLNEGEEIYKDVVSNIESILKLLTEVPQFEQERIQIIKDRLNIGFTELTNSGNFDNNRYEQEIIFYLEKLDINEEKSRLKKHCEYFIETINKEESAGKKLAFISQEIGREINTLGSKAHHVEMQKIVVMMKDNLEKIKEQLLNAL